MNFGVKRLQHGAIVGRQLAADGIHHQLVGDGVDSREGAGVRLVAEIVNDLLGQGLIQHRLDVVHRDQVAGGRRGDHVVIGVRIFLDPDDLLQHHGGVGDGEVDGRGGAEVLFLLASLLWRGSSRFQCRLQRIEHLQLSVLVGMDGHGSYLAVQSPSLPGSLCPQVTINQSFY